MEQKYVVIKDLHGGEFGMGRAYNADEWREQAFEWTDTDGGFENEDEANDYKQMLMDMGDDEVIGYISEVWSLDFGRLVEFKELGKRYAVEMYPTLNKDKQKTWGVHQLDEDYYPTGEELTLTDPTVVKIGDK